jgi:hypothetical protein
MYCDCMAPVGVRQGVADIWDELKEYVEEPSMDEFSDVMYGLGRLIAGLFGKSYFRMPFDTLHVEKIQGRMSEFGCIRSRRHLVDGRCPSE